MIDLSAYRWRKLDPAQGYKPLDFGLDGLTGSVNAEGRLVAVNAYHPQHGYMMLTATPPFPEDQRYEQTAVRAYRRSMVNSDGFGLAFDRPIAEREAYLIEDAIPFIRLKFADDAWAECLTFCDGRGVAQLWRFSEPRAALKFSGQVWLRRAAYTQITEGGPLPPLADGLQIENHGAAWQINNANLGARAFLIMGQSMMQENKRGENAGELILAEDGTLSLGGELPATTDFVFYAALYPMNDPETFENPNSDALNQNLAAQLNKWRDLLSATPDDLALRRGLIYSLNLAVKVSPEARCILTDHMLLPLSWNRDAYYSARALLNWVKEAGAEVVQQHLIWLFEVAERPNHTWGRAYLANGQIKDKGYQLDQQLFPLLEFAEYVQEQNDLELMARLASEVHQVITAILARKAPNFWLFPTDETPADDPIAQPYHLSSHILMWHTFKKLAQIDLKFGHDLAALAEKIRAAVLAHFVVEHEGRKIFAYAVDGLGGYHLYHDANDMPLAYASLWGFCRADDPVWLATLEFAFSNANEGVFEGLLGSVHTRAPWPLGDLQELIIASLTNDPQRAANARQRLAKAAQWDGALPEAYNAQDFSVAARHWFVWPNAMLACLDQNQFNK